MGKETYVKAYPKELRDQVVKLMQVGDRSVRAVAEGFGISVDSVRRWLRQAECDQGRRKDGLATAERKELARLRRENRRLKTEVEILSKAEAWFARETGSGAQASVLFVKGDGGRARGSIRSPRCAACDRRPQAQLRGLRPSGWMAFESSAVALCYIRRGK